MSTVERLVDSVVGTVSVAERSPKRMLSIVIPAYNEQDNLRRMYARLTSVLACVELEWEVIFCVDPCTDRTEDLILERCDEDPRVKMLRFSRRFGQPMATIAGPKSSTRRARSTSRI